MARDWQYNLEQGIIKLKWANKIAKDYLQLKNIPLTDENLAIATYAAYNGGTRSVGRSFTITNGNETEVHENDSVYLDYFKDYAKESGVTLW